MKKQYINPTMMVVKVQTTHMIALSLGVGAEGSANEAEGRDSYDWDDDEY